MGLDKKPFMPLSKALRRSSSNALAVMARIGIFASAGSSSARICRVAVHLNGLGVLLLLYLLCALCAAAGQQRQPHYQCRKHGNNAVHCSFVRQNRSPHNSWAAAALRQSCYGSLVRTSPPARVCAVKPAHGNDAVIFAYFLFCAAPFPRKGTAQERYKNILPLSGRIFNQFSHIYP